MKQFDLQNFLDEALGKMSPESLYNDPAHEWEPKNQTPSKWRGGCPWHESTTGTAFYVDFDKNYWRCPACEMGGHPLKYYWGSRFGVKPSADLRGQEFIEVCKRLADETGTLFPEKRLTQEERETLKWLESRRYLLELCQEYQNEILKGSLKEEYKKYSLQGKLYLRERGFTKAEVETLINDEDYQLGFMPWDGDVLTDMLLYLESAGFTLSDMMDHGIIRESKPGEYMPTLANRIVVPWRDARGQILTQYGRDVAGKTDKKAIALPNPKNRQFATKASPLMFNLAVKYGEYKDLVAVEGLFDVLAAQLKGDRRVVAWVAFPNNEQIATLQGYNAHSVSNCLDPDEGGKKGTKGAVLKLAEAGIAPYVCPELPDNQDPDEFIMQNGLELWKEYTEKRIHGFRWLIQYLDSQFGTNDADTVSLMKEVKVLASRLLKTPVKEQISFFWDELKKIREIDEIEVDRVIESHDDLFSRIREVLTTSTAIKTEVASLEDVRKEAQMSDRAFYSIVSNIRDELSSTSDLELLDAYIKADLEVFDPFKAFPQVLAQEFLEMSKISNFDVLFYVQSFLPVVATLIGSKSHMILNHTWKEPAILWTATVGRSGVGKTPTQQRMFRFLEQLKGVFDEAHKQKKEVYEDLLATWQSFSSDEKRANKNNPYVDPTMKENQPGKAETIVVQDAQVESVMRRLEETNNKIHDGEPAHGILYGIDELLGWFTSMDQYKGGKGNSRQLFLSLYTPGSNFTSERVNQEESIRIKNPRLSLTGGIQPAKLRNAFSEQDEDGMLARFLIALPSEPSEMKWNYTEQPDEPERLFEQVYRRIHEHPGLGDLYFGKGTEQVWGDFYERTWVKWADYKDQEYLANYYAKLPRHVARLALVLHHVENAIQPKADPYSLEIQTLNRAIYMGEFFVRQLQLVYGLFMAKNAQENPQELILQVHNYARDRMRKGNPKTSAKLVSSHRTLSKVYGERSIPTSYVCEMFETLAGLGHGTVEGSGTKMTYSPLSAELQEDFLDLTRETPETQNRQDLKNLKLQFSAGQIVRTMDDEEGKIVDVDPATRNLKMVINGDLDTKSFEEITEIIA